MMVTRERGRRRPTARGLKPALAIAVGICCSGTLVWQASYAAFSGQTTNATNSFAAGSVALTDNDATVAMFPAITGLKPGSTGQACIQVNYTGSLPLSAPIKVYATNPTNDATLAGALLFSVEMSSSDSTIATSGSSPACDALTLASMTPLFGDPAVSVAGAGTKTLHEFYLTTNYANGTASWSATAGQTRVFRFRYVLPASTTDDASSPTTMQGTTTTFGVVWEAQA